MIDTTKKYFVPMRPIHNFFGSCSFTSSNDAFHYTLCRLEPYEFGGFEYKLYAKAEDDDYGIENYYTSTFESFIDGGIVIPVDSESMHVEMMREIEPIAGSAYLVHEYEVVVRN